MSGPSQTLPHYTSTTITPRKILIIETGAGIQGEDITLDSGNADAGNTPTWRFRDGNVVVLVTATGRYVEADDAAGDVNQSASASALETADVDWQSTTITVRLGGKGGLSFDVVLGAADDTDAEVVTALNANATFAAHCLADVDGGVVRIRTRRAGADQNIHVTSSLATAYGASGIGANGTDADYRVTTISTELQDENGTAIHAPVENLLAAHFDESELIVGGAAATADTTGAWAEARAVLSRRGAIFG